MMMIFTSSEAAVGRRRECCQGFGLDYYERASTKSVCVGSIVVCGWLYVALVECYLYAISNEKNSPQSLKHELLTL